MKLTELLLVIIAICQALLAARYTSHITSRLLIPRMLLGSPAMGPCMHARGHDESQSRDSVP